MTPLDRVLGHVSYDHGCWEWTGRRTRQGYGASTLHGETVAAHRVTYRLLVGEIPPGLELDHLCRNRSCVNPDHLEPVSHHENCRRGSSPAAVNMNKTHCGQGHELSGANLMVIRGRHRDCRTCHRKRTRESRKALWDSNPAWRERAKAASRNSKARTRAVIATKAGLP